MIIMDMELTLWELLKVRLDYNSKWLKRGNVRNYNFALFIKARRFRGCSCEPSGWHAWVAFALLSMVSSLISLTVFNSLRVQLLRTDGCQTAQRLLMSPPTHGALPLVGTLGMTMPSLRDSKLVSRGIRFQCHEHHFLVRVCRMFLDPTPDDDS
jgi:hypothetical protein